MCKAIISSSCLHLLVPGLLLSLQLLLLLLHLLQLRPQPAKLRLQLRNSRVSVSRQKLAASRHQMFTFSSRERRSSCRCLTCNDKHTCQLPASDPGQSQSAPHNSQRPHPPPAPWKPLLGAHAASGPTPAPRGDGCRGPRCRC